MASRKVLLLANWHGSGLVEGLPNDAERGRNRTETRPGRVVVTTIFPGPFKHELITDTGPSRPKAVAAAAAYA